METGGEGHLKNIILEVHMRTMTARCCEPLVLSGDARARGGVGRHLQHGQRGAGDGLPCLDHVPRRHHLRRRDGTRDEERPAAVRHRADRVDPHHQQDYEDCVGLRGGRARGGRQDFQGTEHPPPPLSLHSVQLHLPTGGLGLRPRSDTDLHRAPSACCRRPVARGHHPQQ